MRPEDAMNGGSLPRTDDHVSHSLDEVTRTDSAHSQDTQSFKDIPRDIPLDGSSAAVNFPGDNSRTAPPNLGERIGPYLLQEKLGKGVSCFVYRGWDEVRKYPVAIKVVNWDNVYDRTAALKQMRTEATALARVKHPRVVRFIDFGFDPRWPYLVMEYIEGRSLGELIRQGGGLPVEWTMYLLSQMIDGLGAVWRAGLVHRDIKPDNILIGPSGGAKLIDFGLAKSDALKIAEGNSGPELAGTAAYVAPEQAKDASWVDHRADIYSVGVTLFEALTGQLPFNGKNRIQMIFHHLNTPPQPPSDLVPEIPSLVSDICLWMMGKSPEDRPQNYDELRQAFDTVMTELGQNGPPQ
ncbi:MAG: serine/threonine protein kinase [Gemmataceae bacterium]